jgi:hypothetical protein
MLKEEEHAPSPTNSSSRSDTSLGDESMLSTSMGMSMGMGNNTQQAKSTSKSSTRSSISWTRWCTLEVPLLFLVTLYAAIYVSHALYMGPLQTLIESYRRTTGAEGGEDEYGYYTDFIPDMTYYGRQCDARDITTNNSNHLLVPTQATTEQAAEIMMTHGAVLIRNLLQPETATQLRDYLETRHAIKNTLPWHERFWGDIGRLSLGLGVDDDPIVGRALQEVANHKVLQTTLEGIVGPDPAIVEISTLTTLHGARSQGMKVYSSVCVCVWLV